MNLQLGKFLESLVLHCENFWNHLAFIVKIFWNHPAFNPENF